MSEASPLDEFAQQCRDYEFRSNGDVVEGTVTDVVPSESRPSVKVRVNVPGDQFAQWFPQPAPDTWQFERLCEHYADGLTEIRTLEQATVPCTKEDGDWRIVVPRTRRERLWSWVYTDTEWKKVFFAPIIANSIKRKDRVSIQRNSGPSQAKLNWARGVDDMLACISGWCLVAFFIGAIVLLL